MALRGCYSCLKYLVFAFNFVFWLLGCSLFGLGLWAKYSPETLKTAGEKATNPVFERLFEETTANNQLAINAIIVLGAIIMVIGFFGCCGAIKENKIMLGMFFFFLLIIFTALLALGIYIVVHKDKVKDHIGKVFKDEVDKSENGDEVSKQFMIGLQKNFKCCGAMYGSSDYSVLNFSTNCEYEYKTTPCATVFYKSLKSQGGVIAGAAVAVAIVMVLGMIFSMLLCCAIREQI